MQKLMMYSGLGLFFGGAAAMDSASMILPVCMVLIGGVLLLIGARGLEN